MVVDHELASMSREQAALAKVLHKAADQDDVHAEARHKEGVVEQDTDVLPVDSVQGLNHANALSVQDVVPTHHDGVVGAQVKVTEEQSFTTDVDIQPHVNEELISVLMDRAQLL